MIQLRQKAQLPQHNAFLLTLQKRSLRNGSSCLNHKILRKFHRILPGGVSHIIVFRSGRQRCFRRKAIRRRLLTKILIAAAGNLFLFFLRKNSFFLFLDFLFSIPLINIRNISINPQRYTCRKSCGDVIGDLSQFAISDHYCRIII